MLTLILHGQVIGLIAIVSPAIAYFLASLSLYGNPRNKLLFHAPVLKPNLEAFFEPKTAGEAPAVEI